jgi:hypothetical protein
VLDVEQEIGAVVPADRKTEARATALTADAGLSDAATLVATGTMSHVGLSIDADPAAQSLPDRADALAVDTYVIGSAGIATLAAVLQIRGQIETANGVAEIGR